MIQLYQNIKINAVNINKALGQFGQIQKIYSSAYTLDFLIRANGKTNRLLIGRGEVYQGLLLNDSGVPQKLRQRDKLLELLRAKLISRTFLEIIVDNLDRAFAVKYMQARRENYFLFFYQGKKLFIACIYYDLDKECYYLLRSWRQEKDIVTPNESDLFKIFDEIGRIDLGDKVSVASITDPIQSELERCEETDNKKKKFLKRKIKNIELDIEKNKKVTDLSQIVNDLDYIAEIPRKINLFGHKFHFKSDSVYGKRDEIFQKIKKLKKGLEILEKRLIDTKSDYEKLEAQKLILPKVFSPVWNNEKQKLTSISTETKSEYIIYKMKNYSLGIGKTSRGNDKLRNDWAKKTDYWFHLEQGTSPHIILKGEVVLDESILSNIAGLFETYLKTGSNTLDLIYTQVKNLKGVKGTPGKVIFKKEKHQRISINHEWKTNASDIVE